jgi:DNA-binding beta-propeller fold protein YncE
VLGGPLVIAGSPTEGEELRARSQAKRDSPEAFAVREQSRTKYEGLGVQAARVDRAVFPGLIEQRAGGAPRFPRGVRLLRYSGPTTAQLELPGGKHGGLESTAVIAKPEAGGRFGPVELGLERSDRGYRPQSPAVPVNIPERLGEGVTALASGVALVPTDSHGVPLHGSEGELQDASVLYANSETDTDTVAKPTSTGFELDAILRSERSPRTLYYKVRLPHGAHLAQSSDGQVEVVDAQKKIGYILPPAAEDASGADVPVTISVVGSTLIVKVDSATDEVQWPIQVDPEYWEDDKMSPGWEECPVDGVCTYGMHNWEFVTSNPSIFEMVVNFAYYWPIASYGPHEYAGIQYETQGESKIWGFETKTIEEYGYNDEVNIDLIKPNGQGGYEYENERKLASSEASKSETICGVPHTETHYCEDTEGYSGNIARFMTNTTAAGTADSFVAKMEVGHVYISQERGPEAGFNTSSPTITVNGTTRPNVLYGAGAWLGPASGAVGDAASDPGVGVSAVRLTSGSSWQEVNIHREGKCLGLKCARTYSGSFTYSPSMENGEHTYRLTAEDEVDATGSTEATIKVDATPPEELGFTGMPETGAEITPTSRTLTVRATDGKAPTASSGVKSIQVSLDGGPLTAVSGSCSPGPCTASGPYTLSTEALSEGVHQLTITATDNAGNVGSRTFSFDVRHASPIAVGPGSVDPTTGQYTLAATDVSLGGASGVSRSFESRDLTAGAGGPLGPQWAWSVGGGEGLTALPSGNVVLTSSSGGQTTFTLNAKGEFEAPKGDENLKIEYKATEHKYVLKEANAGNETVFEQPSGTQSTPPAYGGSFGAEAGVLNRPVSDALDASGNVWVTDWSDDRIAKFTSAGTLVGVYGSEGSEAGQFRDPFGIAVNQATGDVYVSDYGNSRIDEFSSSGSFIRAFGWGVIDNKDERETCTSGCLPGIAGAGAGQLDGPDGVAIDSSGDVWVAEEGSDRVQEFSESGSYITSFGSAGSGAGQFAAPMDVAFEGGDVYVTDQNNNRIDEFTTGGTFIKAIGFGVTNGEAKLQTCTSSCRAGVAGSGNGQFYAPRGLTTDPISGSLYVVNMNSDCLQEVTTAGAFVSKVCSGGSGRGQFNGPMGVAMSSTGIIYITDFNNSRVQEWSRQTWWPTSAKGAIPGQTTYTYTPVESSEGTTTMQPYEIVSAPPPGVECGTKAEELKEEKDKGCRALTFKYATETKAKGENESEWGEYKGHISQVFFHAWNPATKAMEEKAVAQYAYDKQGRLRTEWDPRVETSTACGKTCSALKTTYGYDTEGHVTAMTTPGQESVAFTYGTIAGDANTGRLLKVTRAPASAALWNGEAVKNTEAPKLSGTPAVGIRMSVTNGAWSNAPVVYGYQWEDCSSACTPILGATNANYTPTSSDVGDALVAEVTAANGDGSVVASSAASTAVASKAGAYTQAVDGGYSLNAVSCIPGTTDCVLSDSAGKALYATNVSTSATATWKTWSGPQGESPSQAVDCPTTSLCMLADGKETAGGKLYYATSLGGPFSEAYSPSYGVDAISCVSASFCVDGQDNYGYYRYSTSPASTSWTLEDAEDESSMKGVFCLSTSFCAIADGSGKVHVATSTSQIEASSWTETDVDGTSALNGIACTSTTSCVAVDGSGNALKLTIEGSGAATAVKHDIDGTTSLTAITCTGSSTCVAVDQSGDVFVSKNGGESWTKEYALADDLTSVSCASASLCATADTTGNVTAFNPNGGSGSEGELRPPQPGSTVEYHVPASGSGAPYALSKEEVEKWGQKDTNEHEDNDPVEGMAVFPADEPQGWPASDYKRATIDYFNGKGLSVDSAMPSGAIATTEYNELNEAIRTLSADNRAAAMKEGCVSVSKKECKSAEVSEKLDTKTEYNPEGSQIVKVLGPEHKVKLSTGEEVEARAVTRDYYDEGAKEVEEKTKETYSLETKTTSGALLPNGKEKDVRTEVTSYSGQEDLGWKLREPTSATVEPTGLDLVHTTEYEPGTGNVIETKTPAAAENIVQQTFNMKWGSYGSKEGQFEAPEAVAVDPKTNDVYVADYALNRVEKFTSSGSFVGWVGSETSGSGEGQLSHPESLAVSSVGNLYVGDAGNHRIEEFNSEGKYVRVFGSEGTGEGEFGNAIYGLAFDGSKKLWATDGANHRIEEFSESGTFEKAFGEQGSAESKLEEPRGIVVSKSELWVVDTVNDRVDEFNTKGKFVKQFGQYGLENGQLREPWGMTADSKGDLYVADRWPDLVEEFNSSGGFVAWIGSSGTKEGQFEDPDGLATDSSNDLYVADQANSRIDKWTPANAGVHGTQTVYYSAEANSSYPSCGKHPEWAGLVCQSQPAAQPNHGLPELAVTTTPAYNMWDETEKTEERFGSGAKAVARTRTETYDPAGRALTSEVTSSPETGKALPKVTDEYNAQTGAVEKQSTSEGTITSKENTLGQLSEYKDASGNVAKYTYEEGGDGRLVEISEGKGEEAKSTETYSYNGTTGLLEKFVDSAAGTFTASYDVEGKMTSEIYPNGMCANTTYNPIGEAVDREYIKTRNCSETGAPVWFNDSRVPSIHGEMLQQTSTLSNESYSYDSAGRLLETQETPAGKGCSTRLYAYDEEGNRISETTRESGSEGKCASGGGIVQRHSYDEANRLTDEGVEYEAFGDITKMPAADANGHEIVSTYYVDSQLASQEQNKQLLSFKYDPMGRAMEQASENRESKAKSTTISHYSGSGDTLSWTSEGSEKWTRDIPGIDGTLSAVQEAGKAPVLELRDLENNIVATAADNESETKPLSTYVSTEFGVPNEGKAPPKYAWLGAEDVSTETSLGSGASFQSGTSYVPQVAITLQTAPVVPPGAFPNGSPGTQATATVSPASLQFAQEQATQAWQTAEAERQKAREEEEQKQLEECRAKGGCGASTEFGEIDPKAHGKWGHLDVTIESGRCIPKEGCEGEFSFKGVLTEKYGRPSTMVLRVVVETDGERVQLDAWESHGEYFPDLPTEKYYIPADGALYFYLDVWVGGKRDDDIGLRFYEEEGEVVY